MFDFLIRNKDNEMQSLAEVITINLEKVNLSKLALEKAVSMIAKAIAKSDIIIQTDSKEKLKQEYRLNVQPNDHESGTEFWTKVVKKLLTEQEALIVPINGKYYRASAFETTAQVLSERIYRNITLTCGGYNFSIYRTFKSPEVIHMKYDNARIRMFLKSVVENYDKTLDAINAMMKISSNPKFKLKIEGNQTFRQKQKDGKEKIVTRDAYAEKIRKLLEEDDLKVLLEPNGISIEQLQVNTNAKAEELTKMALAINNETANAFDIPEAVFNGNITEKSDATNEFITYAVGPVAEVINDTLTAYIVGEDDFCKKNEKVIVWLARFKHVDVVDSAVNLDKLRGIGFNYDELRVMVGYPELHTEFSQARALTANYKEENDDET